MGITKGRDVRSPLAPIPHSHSPMSSPGEVLIAIINDRADLKIAHEQHWYRIPIEQVEKLKQRQQWHPKWLAFYQTKVFGEEAFAVNYYAEVTAIHEVQRRELFPEEPKTAKSEKCYCKLELGEMQRLEQAIVSNRLKRITFIPTTWGRFILATEISELLKDLYPMNL